MQHTSISDGPRRLRTLVCVLVCSALCPSLTHANEEQPTSAPAFTFPTLPETLRVGGTLRLEVQPPPSGRFEYRWLLKVPGEDWDWSATWTADAEYMLSPAHVGTYAVQVNIRDAHTQAIVTKRWLGETRVMASRAAVAPVGALRVYQPHDVPGFRLPLLPPRLGVGETVCLAVERLVPGDYEYCWHCATTAKDWSGPAGWSTSPHIAFTPKHPGHYHWHLTVRASNSQEVVLDQPLGTITVAGPLVGEFFHTPAAISVPVGLPLHFRVLRRGFPIDTLEFRLLELSPVLRVVHDWQRWPLPPYVADAPKITGLQIDVRLRDTPDIVDKHWINTFCFYEPQAIVPGHSLLRALISDDFELLDHDTALQQLAEELGLAAHLLLWEFDHVSAEDQQRRLAGLTGVVSVTPAARNQMDVKLACGTAVRIDLTARTYAQENSPVRLTIALEQFPRYRLALEQLRDLPTPTRLFMLLHYAVYEGYHYGTPPQFDLTHVNNPISHCGSQAKQLHRMLALNGHRPAYVWITATNPDGDQAGHVVVHMPGTNGAQWLLDPSNGFVYPLPAEWDGRIDANLPAPIRLPACRTLDYVDLRTLCAGDCQVRRSDRVQPDVVPPLAPPPDTGEQP
jgi:hypothetical protein